MTRVRALILALVLVVAGGGTADALVGSPVDTRISSETRYACGGVEPVMGVCLDSPLDTLDETLEMVDGLLS